MRRVRGAATRSAELILWDDGCRQIVGVEGSGDLAKVELTRALESGAVRALDRITYKDGELEAYELLPDFWKANPISFRRYWRYPDSPGELGFTKNPLPLMGRERGAKHHIFFRRADFEARWSGASGASTAPTAKPDKRKPGPRPQRDWPTLAAAELIRRAASSQKIPLDNDSKVADQLGQWFVDQFDWQPDNSDLRQLIGKLLAPSRNSR
jgi:hypothetical protein